MQHPAANTKYICRGNNWGSSVWIRRNMSATDNVFCIRQALDKKLEYNEAIYRLQESLWFGYRREVLCNILIEFGIRMKLVGLIKMCVNETYRWVRVGKHLPDMFPVSNDLKCVFSKKEIGIQKVTYTSLVRPIPEYGAACWDPCREGHKCVRPDANESCSLNLSIIRRILTGKPWLSVGR